MATIEFLKALYELDIAYICDDSITFNTKLTSLASTYGLDRDILWDVLEYRYENAALLLDERLLPDRDIRTDAVPDELDDIPWSDRQTYDPKLLREGY